MNAISRWIKVVSSVVILRVRGDTNLKRVIIKKNNVHFLQ